MRRQERFARAQLWMFVFGVVIDSSVMLADGYFYARTEDIWFAVNVGVAAVSLCVFAVGHAFQRRGALDVSGRLYLLGALIGITLSAVAAPATTALVVSGCTMAGLSLCPQLVLPSWRATWVWPASLGALYAGALAARLVLRGPDFVGIAARDAFLVGGVPIGAIALCWFIARLLNQQLAEALEDAEAASLAKSQFLANMSHELRTPLNAIIGYSELVREDVRDGHVDPEAIDADLGHAVGAAKHLVGLIDDVLDLSRIEHGHLELHLEQLRLATLIDEVRRHIAPLVHTRGNTLVTEHALGHVRLEADSRRLKPILINLLSNANKFTHEGTVTLGATLDEEHLVLEVRDTGIGIPAERLDSIFERFMQVDDSHTRQYDGTGLGLAVSAQLATLMGYTIEVESALGAGTTFSVRVPRAHVTDKPHVVLAS